MKRYRLKLATWTVVREPGEPSPRKLDNPEAVARLAEDLIQAADDDKEHFWAIYLNAQNHYLMHTEVSAGSQLASIVHPREVLGPAIREGGRTSSSSTTIRQRRTSISPGSWPKERGSSAFASTTTS